MKKLFAALSLAAAFAAGSLVTAQMRDWHDLDKVHNKILDAISDMERARAANHYDMAGHGAKAEQFLHQAEHEVNLAIQSARGQ